MYKIRDNLDELWLFMSKNDYNTAIKTEAFTLLRMNFYL